MNPCAEVANRAEPITNSRKTNLMRKTIETILLIAAISGLTSATHAQTIVVAGDNFNSDSPGIAYGGVAWNYDSPPEGNPAVSIDTDNPDGPTNSQNCVFKFDTTSGQLLNFGMRTDYLPATGNTNTLLANYTLEFDMAVVGVDIPSLGGYIGPTIALFGTGSGLYYGNGVLTNPSPSYFPNAGAGYQHYSIPLGGLPTANAALLNPTSSSFAFCIGFYMAGPTYTGTEEIDIGNLQLLMNTNPPPPPQPTMTVLPAKPGLRIFAQNSAATYNQEGFGTLDSSQSWVGSATSNTPVSYSITFQDFNTINGYAFAMQMPTQTQNNSTTINPYLVYYATNAFVWTITAQSTGFTWSLDWKTNAPANGEGNHVTNATTTSSNGIGTWTLTFTSDTNGNVTPPGGPAVAFTLPSESLATNFANPMNICFGTAPNGPAGYGQYIDISRVAISNVAGVTEYDDFTTNAAFDTTQWSPAFSVDAGSVVQVSTNTPLWLNWTEPDTGYGLETKANLGDTNTPWYSPAYWNAVTLTPRKMGTSNVWVLIPTTCLPTVEGVQGGTPSPKAFFRLSNPPPTQ